MEESVPLNLSLYLDLSDLGAKKFLLKLKYHLLVPSLRTCYKNWL